MNNYTVDILTPSKIVAKGLPAESLLVPTVRGQINVLKDHTHIVSKLSTGIVTVFGGEDDPDRYFSVTTGVCKVLVLANTSEEDHEIDVERAKQSLQHAQEMLQSSLTDEELTKYRRKVERAQLRVQLASYKG